MTASPALYLVFDFLIVVPDPRRISSVEVGKLMREAWDAPDPQRAFELLARSRDKVRTYVDTPWNVERGP